VNRGWGRKKRRRRRQGEETKRRIIEEEERREEAKAEGLKAERSQAEEQGWNLLGLTTPEEGMANTRNTLLVRMSYL
jgi:nucleoporin GLE1